MTPAKLDFIFPFLVFFYGFLMLFVLELPLLIPSLQQKGAELLQHLEPKRKLAWLCLCVGAVWSLQNLLFS